MVGKQLIELDNNSLNHLKLYLNTEKTYIAVAKYLRKFQQASELIKLFQPCH